MVTDPVSGRGQVLRVGFPKGNGFPGHAAEIVLPDSVVATVQYRMLFDASFRSTMYGGATVGGKLPGLGAVGGTSAYDTGSVGRTVSGLKPPMHCVGPVRPSDGWSARHMWSAGGGLHQYLYHSGRRNNCGDANHLLNGRDAAWEAHSSRRQGLVEFDRWYTVTERVDTRSGTVTTWLDGQVAAHTTGLHLSPVNRIIWAVYVNKPGPETATAVFFDDVIVTTEAAAASISHGSVTAAQAAL